MSIQDHPTVQLLADREGPSSPGDASPIDESELHQLCLDAGADDAGFVSIDRAELAEEVDDIKLAYSKTRTLISLVFRIHHENIRSVARSLANKEFHASDERVTEVSRTIVSRLAERGVSAAYTAMGFPLEADRFPGKIWLVSHKRVAEAAGLGRMGIHRNLIHPKFGNFILLGTILIDRDVRTQSVPIDYNPCLECKLCVAACPVGAISADGHFDFSSCYTHNYREFMGGFQDYVETAVESKSRYDHRKRVRPSESVSMWQSLSFGANYKAAYCMAVCPAGEDVIQPFLDDRKTFQNDVLKPLQAKVEPIYVVPETDAHAHVEKRYPHKQVRFVENTLRVSSVAGFLKNLPNVFQRERARGLDASYHFVFSGAEERRATITIRDQALTVREGLHGDADLRITADSKAWVEFLERQSRLVRLLLTRRIRLRGKPRWLVAFGRCFPK